MQNIGFDSVYQLEGGILKYFEEVGGAHYTAIASCSITVPRSIRNWKPTETVQCFACRAVVTPREQLSPYYIPGKSCPHCKKAMREMEPSER